MKIALVGNQNSGKTTLFNLLTGSNQKIGNWPGVTIEKKEGIIKESNHTLIDLPGIYSLSPYSIEEELSTKYLLENKIDLIINVVDANCLERSLYLTTELLELDCKVVIALSMKEILNKAGLDIDIKKLEKLLGIPIIDLSTLKNSIAKEVINIIEKAVKKELPIFSKDIESMINSHKNNFTTNKRYNSIKLLKSDNIHLKTLEDKYKCDIFELLSSQRYQYIESIINSVIKGNKKVKKNYLDKILLNRILAIPIFLFIMMFIYYFAIGIVGEIFNDIITNTITFLNNKIYLLLNYLHVSNWLISLISNGIISGVGSILTFLPQLTVLFLLIEVLEQTGYMARISFILDGMCSKIGISGKSLIPFIMGLGCSVPGVMATRIIEDKAKREKTIFLTPFIPCSAKLPIIIMVSSYFFKQIRYFPALMYLISIIIIILSSLILKKIYVITEVHSYVMELPKYKLPNLIHVKNVVKDKIISFIQRAGSVILICSIVIWLLLSFSPSLEYNVNIQNSILALIGHKISWLFYPFLGINDWRVSVSIIQGIIAKEQVVSSMSVISGVQNNVFNSEVFSYFTPISAISFLTFNLFSIPCFNTIVAMKKELGSNLKVILGLLFQLIVAFLVSTIIYQVGSRIW